MNRREDDGSTPLTPEEREALIPSYITQRRELNEAEQRGIADADRWAFSRKRDVLNQAFLCRLHERMFGDMWKWAGQIRTTARNLGVDAWDINPQLHRLLEDVRYWIERRTYDPDEIGVRFHHRLVQIHPFPNGNGRLSRLAADLLAIQLGRERFTWGSTKVVPVTELRKRYVAALHAADDHEISPLIEFARS